MMSPDPEEQARPVSAASKAPSSPQSTSVIEGLVDDARVTKMRHRCIVLALIFIAAVSIAGVVVPLVLDNCDCLPGRGTSEDTSAPNATPTTAVPGTPTATPTMMPTMSGQTQRFEQFLEAFLVPRLGADSSLNGLGDENSPQFKAAEFITGPDEIADMLPSQEHVGDRYALAVLYEATNGDGWMQCSATGSGDCPTGQSWMDPNVSHCSWYGVECNADGRVTSVSFGTYTTVER